MTKKLPVYDLDTFQKNTQKSEFYCKHLQAHVKEHKFTNRPHKHDFYLVMIVTGGSGWHEVDFVRYPVQAGSVFMLQPGQMHYWKLSAQIKGYVFFHSKAFYNEGYTMTRIQDLSFFNSFQCEPNMLISVGKMIKIKDLMEEVIHEYRVQEKLGLQKIHALINILYIEISRVYKKQEHNKKQLYLLKLNEFESLIDNNFKKVKSASDYASMLNVSEKHMNRITKQCLNKTSTRLIADRILLEAKRLLIQNKLNVSQIAYELGYTDNSYFVRVFKKYTGQTPLSFLNKYQISSLNKGEE